MGWFILNKYYQMTEDAPVYAAALLLDPSKRIAYIKQNWPEKWHDSTISSARRLWQKEFNHDPTSGSTAAPISMQPPPKRKPNQLDILLKTLEVRTIGASARDDFDAFINAESISLPDRCTPLQWWCQDAQRRTYPKLSRMAISILSIPAESSEPERTFSGARRTCSWDRCRLTCTNIEMIECVGSWLRYGLIRSVRECGMGLPASPPSDDEWVDIEDDSEDCIDWY